METLRSLPNQPVTFSINPDNHSVEIKSEFGRYKLIGQNAADFPKIPEVSNDSSFDTSAGVLSACISNTLFATGNDELRLSLTGVYVQLEKDHTTFVATDANRLVKVRRGDMAAGMNTNFILPKKALNLLKANLPHDDTAVKVSLNESNAHFSYEDVNLICRLIDEKYPDYKAVIPEDNPNKLQVSRQEFLNSVRRISIFANKTTNQINLKITGSEMTISC